jgi:hypothetical protein
MHDRAVVRYLIYKVKKHFAPVGLFGREDTAAVENDVVLQRQARSIEYLASSRDHAYCGLEAKLRQFHRGERWNNLGAEVLDISVDVLDDGGTADAPLWVHVHLLLELLAEQIRDGLHQRSSRLTPATRYDATAQARIGTWEAVVWRIAISPLR